MSANKKNLFQLGKQRLENPDLRGALVWFSILILNGLMASVLSAMLPFFHDAIATALGSETMWPNDGYSRLLTGFSVFLVLTLIELIISLRRMIATSKRLLVDNITQEFRDFALNTQIGEVAFAAQLCPPQKRERFDIALDLTLEISKAVKSVPQDCLHAFLWLMKARIPSLIRELQTLFTSEGIELGIDHQIQISEILGKRSHNYLVVERNIPEDFETAWTPNWRRYMDRQGESFGRNFVMCFLVQKEHLNSRTEGLGKIVEQASKIGIKAMICNSRVLLEGFGYQELPYRAVEFFDGDLCLAYMALPHADNERYTGGMPLRIHIESTISSKFLGDLKRVLGQHSVEVTPANYQEIASKFD